MFTNLDHMKDLPATIKVHEAIGSALFRRFGIKAFPPRTEHDPMLRFEINDTSFHAHIVAERDSRSYGQDDFAWNGRWRISLDGCGFRFTIRPRFDELSAAADKICNKLSAFISWDNIAAGRPILRLIVDNTR